MKQKVGMDEMRQQVEREAPVVALVFALITILLTIVLFPKFCELKDRYMKSTNEIKLNNNSN